MLSIVLLQVKIFSVPVKRLPAATGRTVIFSSRLYSLSQSKGINAQLSKSTFRIVSLALLRIISWICDAVVNISV